MNNLKLYARNLECKLEQQKQEADNYKKWIGDLLSDTDSTIYLNICAYAGKLAVALSNARELEQALAVLKDYTEEYH